MQMLTLCPMTLYWYSCPLGQVERLQLLSDLLSHRASKIMLMRVRSFDVLLLCLDVGRIISTRFEQTDIPKKGSLLGSNRFPTLIWPVPSSGSLDSHILAGV